MNISQETRERIIDAANQLYEQAGRLDFPTVDAVRRTSKTNMNDASAIMKEWRRMQTATAAPVAVAVPVRVQQASQAAIAALWSDALGIATEALHAAQAGWERERAEAETLRGELSAAFEAQAVELSAAQIKIVVLDAEIDEAARQITELREEITAAVEREHTAATRAIEIERRADDLKIALAAAQEAAKTAAAELDAERQRHAVRLAQADTDRDAARKDAGGTREDAAKLRGQIEAMQAQTADLMRVFAEHRAPEDSAAKPTATKPRSKKLSTVL
ncbi:MAG: DNA-binding protein [Gallionella sp.]|nr:DNA-binding protein [Gallionella sp.]